jgi:hypothetical protein
MDISAVRCVTTTQGYFDGLPECSLFTIETLWYVSGPSCDFLTKLLGVDIPLFLFNTEFYCPPLSPFVRKSHESSRTYVVNGSSVDSVFAFRAGGFGSNSIEVIF